MYNISQVLTDEKKIYVTKTGFENVDGTYTLDDSDYEEITINASTKIVRMDEDRDESADMSITQQQTFQSTI